MNSNDLRPGLRLTNRAMSPEPRTAMVIAVTRAPWRRTVTRFWLRWDDTGSETEQAPGDAAYLEVIR